MRQESGTSRDRWVTIDFIAFLVLCGFLTTCLVLGGASQKEDTAHIVLAWLSIAVLAWCTLDLRLVRLPRPNRMLVAGLAVLGLTVLLQLVPLPVEVWNQLPGRGELAVDLEKLAVPLRPRPLSLQPERSLTAAFGILPPLAVLVLAGKVRWTPRTSLGVAFLVIGLAALSTLLGLVQVFAGTNVLYPGRVDDHVGLPIGVFANANHQAILIVAALPFVAIVWRRVRTLPSRSQTRAVMVFCTSFILGIMLFGLALAGSVAAWILTMPAMAGLAMVARMKKRNRGSWIVLGAMIVFMILSIGLAINSPFFDGLNMGLAHGEATWESRLEYWDQSVDLAADHFPFGSGFGTFRAVYAAHEPHQYADILYVNHVHNDYIETVLELGLPGLVLLVSGLFAWAVQTGRIWGGSSAAAWSLPRAASISSFMLLLHSVVDYPLRTPALACVFALALVLMVSKNAKPVDRSRIKPDQEMRISAHRNIEI